MLARAGEQTGWVMYAFSKMKLRDDRSLRFRRLDPVVAVGSHRVGALLVRADKDEVATFSHGYIPQ